MKRVKISFVFPAPTTRRTPQRAPVECHTVEGVVQESQMTASQRCTKLILHVQDCEYWYELRNGQAPQVLVGQKVILHVIGNMVVGIEFLDRRNRVIFRLVNLDTAHREAALRVTSLE